MRKVLVLDDNEDILQIVTEILVYEHFEVHGIRTCAELMPAAESFQPDIILLDFLLNDGNGGEMCRQLKGYPSFSGIPMIIFTAYLAANDSLEHYGCDALITKPFDLEDLLETVNELVGC